MKHPIFSTTLFGLLTLFISAICLAQTGQEIKTNHFTLFSDAPSEKLNKLVRELEYFRALAAKLANIRRMDTEKPLRLLVLDDIENIYSADRPTAGFSKETSEAYYIVADFSDKERARGFLFRELVRHWNTIQGYELPPWYNTGLANVLATMEFKRKEALFGGPPPGALQVAGRTRLRGLEQIFTSDPTIGGSRKGTTQFQSFSWLLMHYLRFGKHDLNKDLRQYLKLWNNPETRETAFDQGFSISHEDLKLALRKYIQSRLPVWNIPLKKLDVKVDMKSRDLSEAGFKEVLAPLIN
ncbi:MAG: hypothetical protein AAF512_06860 [Pseudomonadota bacterium]